MEQYTVEFYEPATDWLGNYTHMEKQVVRTGKTTIPEAMEVAVKNGADPRKQMRLIWEV